MKDTIVRFLDDNTKAMHGFLETLINIQSGTANKAGVDAVSDCLIAFLEQHGCTARRIARANVGDVLIVDSPAARAAPHPILLSGHMDTVFPVDTPFNTAWYDGDTLHGPGTCDMKGGLVVAIYATLAVFAAGRTDIPLRFIFSPDEEISSLNTRPVLQEEAEKAAMALVFEMAGPHNELVRTRKGKIGLFATIHGEAGHAAFITDNKISAIHDAARKIELLESLCLPESINSPKSLSVNVGYFTGGIGVNTVPELAELHVEARCTTAEQLQYAGEAMRRILTTPQIVGTRTEIYKDVYNIPLEAQSTEALYGLAEQVGTELRQSLGEEYRPGWSEAAFMAATGLPVIDGLGPQGGHDHSDREYLVLSSMRERVELTAHLIVRAWEAWQAGDLPRLPKK